MLDFIYHMTLKLFLNHIFGVKTLGICDMRGVKSVIPYMFCGLGVNRTGQRLKTTLARFFRCGLSSL